MFIPMLIVIQKHLLSRTNESVLNDSRKVLDLQGNGNKNGIVNAVKGVTARSRIWLIPQLRGASRTIPEWAH